MKTSLNYLRQMSAFIVAGLVSVASQAAPVNLGTFVPLKDGRELWVEDNIPTSGSANPETVILINGLTYTTKPWQPMVTELVSRGYRVVTYDPWGMGKTLEKGGPAKDIITLQQQVDDLAELAGSLKVQSPAVVGLSYGGVVALQFAISHPELKGPTILMAPYVKALAAQDQQIRQKIQMYRLMHPQDKKTDDELYDQYLHDLIFQTYPIYEPVVKDHPWRLEAIYQMVRGVRKFVAADAVQGQNQLDLYLVMAGRDQYVPRQDHLDFWAATPANSRHAAMTIEGSEHKIPEVQPRFAAAWIDLILQQKEPVTHDLAFTGKPAQGVAVSADGTSVVVH